MSRDNPRLWANSGKQDGRDFNNRGRERGRQPNSFRSCEEKDQKAAQVASEPPGPLSRCEDEAHGDQAEGRQQQSKVEQTRVRVVWSQDAPGGQRREEVGMLQEDRSMAVIAKAISEATEAVEKASAEAQSYIAEVREGSDGTQKRRMNSSRSQPKQFSVHRRGGRVIEEVNANMLQGIMQSASESESDDDEERGTRTRPRSPRPVTNRKDPVETRRDGRTDVIWSPS